MDASTAANAGTPAAVPPTQGDPVTVWLEPATEETRAAANARRCRFFEVAACHFGRKCINKHVREDCFFVAREVRPIRSEKPMWRVLARCPAGMNSVQPSEVNIPVVATPKAATSNDSTAASAMQAAPDNITHLLFDGQALGPQPGAPQPAAVDMAPPTYHSLHARAADLRANLNRTDLHLRLSRLEANNYFDLPHYLWATPESVINSWLVSFRAAKDSIAAVETRLRQNWTYPVAAQPANLETAQQFLNTAAHHVLSLWQTARELRRSPQPAQLFAAAQATSASVHIVEEATMAYNTTREDIMADLARHCAGNEVVSLQQGEEEQRRSVQRILAFAPYTRASVSAPLTYTLQTAISTPMASENKRDEPQGNVVEKGPRPKNEWECPICEGECYCRDLGE